ncbi:hypothetical protein L1987_11157 [Smallanthus sonchifolius]|uniref:Uncharacterized protein n=1 Tax=Smallanthus sonchifolius TaxID=185202 RepID=A0ACB9JB45_9ASTR|nr:hypothetical protein L1987_11157 [Smallanthus sonchifolius]
MELQKLMLSAVVITGFLSTIAQSVRFEIESGRTKCISEDIKSNSMTVGHYSVVNPNEGHPLPESHKLTLRVTSVYGNSYHYADHVQSGQFSFQVVEGGDYLACFFALDHHPSIKFSVDFDWRSGLATKDWSSVAKKGSIDAMELELKKLEDTITSIHEEMFYLREREHDMQQLNLKTNSRMALLSFLSLFVCLSVAGLQVWHLKSFFEKKKLI